MKKRYIVLLAILALVGLIAVKLVGTYNTLSASQQQVNLALAQVETQYQRRYDLVPNLVNTVKGQANFEQKTLTDVVNARASATNIKLSVDDLSEENLQKLQQAQDGLSGALSRLLMVTENYPSLQSNEAFLNLQAQLEGIENRIAFARDDFNQKVLAFNTLYKTFPNNLFGSILGFKLMPYFQAVSGAQNAPVVDFGN
ncbi:LemA family protein [Psittacicella melopsittaci]|uniref:LemA family protein n=1 Tax=Psittacicella melopsittaci TaxID=2028576 RepID=A0A3A1Y3H7_9GAMM|nr:LemA family protein [Psittacicella melopsittaci]RIY32001.1 LemA family protein [Psittacicella melopsittaci]